MSRCILKLRVALLTACGLALLVSSGSDPHLALAEPASDSSQSTIEYRRIYVPADKMESWPRDGEKYIPVESRDFDTWVRSANAVSASRDSIAAIDRAEYTVRLANDGHLLGEGRWTIVLRGDKPIFMPLGNMSLVLRNARWHDSPQRPVRLGIWGQNGHEPDRLGLEVNRSGVLEFDWHIQTHPNGDQIEIPWHVPAANSERLVLDLPEGKLPHIEGGVVLESSRLPTSNKTADIQLRRWTIARSAQPDSTLRILNAERKIPAATYQIAIREDVGYHIGPRGLDINAAWQLDVPADQARELTVSVPPRLQLTSFKADGRDLTWRLERDSSLPSDTAHIYLPKANGAKPLQVTLDAWQPLVLDAPWRLPRLRPEGVFWTSGNFKLSIDSAYELKRLQPTDCLESDVSSINAGADAPETHSLIAYSSAAVIEIDLSQRQSDATVRAGSSLSLADPDLNGRLITRWKLSRGNTHHLVGKLAAGWMVEAVETVPADAMTEWFVDRHGDERQIEIQLSRAASATRDVSVIVTGRLQRFSLAERLSAETLRMVTWSNARTSRHLLTFQTNEPYVVEPVGELPNVAPDVVTENEREVLEQSTDNTVFDLTNAGKGAGLQLALRRSQYAAQIRLELIYENGLLHQDYHLTAVPASSPIDRVLVYLTGPLGDGIRWTDKASNTLIMAERLAAGDPQRANLPKEGDAWLLRLSQPTSRPIEIFTSTTTKRPQHVIVPLASLPEATQQHGQVLVRSRRQNSLWLEPAHLQSVPLPPASDESRDRDYLPPVCAAYRYQPADCRDAVRSPKLLASATSDGDDNPLTARRFQLESYFWPDGNGTHRATYQLENRGATEMKLSLPADARLVSASLDGHALDLAPPADRRAVVIHLPPKSLSTQVSLYIETRGSPLTAGRELDAPLVLSDLPYLSGDWVIWLPEEYAATGAGIANAASEFNWRQRLFGLFGRPTGAQPFNPFRLVDGTASISEPPPDTSREQSQVAPPDRGHSARLSAATVSAVPAIGWHRFDESFIANGPPPIIVTHPPAITAWAVVLLLACLLCGRWLRRKQPEFFAIAVAVAASVALFLPLAYADLAAGAVLGLLLSLIAGWPKRSISIDDSVHRRRAKSAVAVTSAVIIAIGLARLSLAQPPKALSSARDVSLPKTARILIPVDSEGRPSGTKYYVSESFLRTLVAAGPDSAESLGQWLLRDATLSGELREEAGTTEIATGNWALTFSIETLVRDTTVVLPLVRKDADWSATAMLDGVPLPLEWRDAERKCAIAIAEPGRYTLALSCRPKTSIVDGLNQIAFAIPSVPGAKVELRIPETASGVTVSNASVRSVTAGGLKTLSGELDRSGMLVVQWSRSEKQGAAKQGFSLTEMRWLDLKPDKSELRVKYILEGAGRRPDFLTVAYDDRWRLLTDEKSITREPADSAGHHVIRVPIAAQPVDRQAVLLRWQLRTPLGLGDFRLPPVGVTSVPVNKHWLAMSSDPSLDCDIPDSSATGGTENEFFERWGTSDSDESPQLVLSNFDPNRAWNLTIRPRETEPVVDEVLNVAAGRTALRVMYDAKVVPGNFGAYRFELSLPAGVSIDGINATEANNPIPLRWSRLTDNRVAVFFGREITKPYQLTLDGATPLDADGKANLPRISAVATEAATQNVHLYRDDDVHIVLDGISNSPDAKSESNTSPPPQWLVRPVAVCYLDGNSAAIARITVKPNDLRIGGETLTALARENGAWSANYRCQLTVESGDLDVLQLRVPSTWTGPFEVQSALPVSSEVKAIDDQTSLLFIRFATTVPKGSSIDLRIHSPLKPSPGAAVVVPRIVPQSLTHRHRYLSVPDSADSSAIAWTESGVRPATVSQKLSDGFLPLTPAHFYEVVSDPFQVASQLQPAPMVVPQIRLADTAVVAGQFGTQLIATRLILAPHGLNECTLQLPAGQKLMNVTLDGRPAVIRPLDSSRFKLTLAAPQLPQSLEVVSRSMDESTGNDPTEWQRPILLADGKKIPAEVSLWSFADTKTSTRRHIEGADEVNALEQSALRFDRMVSIAEAAKTTASELTPPDGYNWFQSWETLLDTVRSQTKQIAVPPVDNSASQVSHTSEEQISQAADRLDKWLENGRKTLATSKTAVSKDSSTPSTTGDSPVSSIVTASGAGQWTYYVAEGGNDRLNLQLRPDVSTIAQIRLVGLLLIACLAALTLWLMRAPAASEFLCRWPHAIGILLGIAYWAWMWPSWLGILIVAINVWLALRFDWPGRSLRTEASTVLRSARPT